MGAYQPIVEETVTRKVLYRGHTVFFKNNVNAPRVFGKVHGLQGVNVLQQIKSFTQTGGFKVLLSHQPDDGDKTSFTDA